MRTSISYLMEYNIFAPTSRMKKSYFISAAVLLLLSLGAHAQPYATNPDFNRTRNWHFGDGVGLRFDPDTVYVVSSNIHTVEAAAVHSGADGNLLLYSNGEKIWNANHEVIHNGNLSLGHHSSNLGSVFVFHEDNPDSIYLFNTYYNISTTKQFSVNLIVREADTFRIAFKDSVLMYSVCEAIAVVKADNGKDIWVVVHEFGANNLYSYLLTAQGIISCPVISKSFSTPFGSPQAAFFTMVFSSDGNYMAKTNTNQIFPTIKRAEVYSFHSGKGKFDFLFSIDSLAQITRGIRFNIDNSYLYVAERDDDLLSFKFNPNDSFTTVSSVNRISLSGTKTEMQVMPYRKETALIRVDTDTYMDFIVNSYIFDSVEVLKEKISLNYSFGFVPPNFNQSYFYTPPYQFHGQDTFSATIHNWLITKQGALPITASSKAPLIEFEDSGIYNVRYIASNGSRSDTVSKEITILPKIEQNFLGNDTGWCNSIGTPIALNAPSSMHCYEWNTGETGSTITADTAGVYIAKIATPNFCVLYDTLVVSVDTTETIETEDNFLGSDKSWCANIDTVVTLSAPAGFDGYAWSNGQTGRETEVNEAGTYWVRVSNRNQCEADGNLYAADTLEITLLPAPPKPILSRIGDSLFVNLSGNYAFKWYFNNAPLTDTLSNLIVRDTGAYFLELSNENCRSYSDTMFVAHLGIDNPLFSQIKLYPNPATTELTIEVLQQGSYTYEITGVAGNQIAGGRLQIGANTIDIARMSAGVYFVHIRIDNNQTATYKLIKQTE